MLPTSLGQPLIDQEKALFRLAATQSNAIRATNSTNSTKNAKSREKGD